MSSMYTDTIALKRKQATFFAGFCLLTKKLSELIEQLHLLHPEEIKHYETLRFDKRKESYLLGRIAAKYAISEILTNDQTLQSIAIQSGVFGFPVVNQVMGQNIQVSISHNDYCGIALAFPEEHPLGIDIEKIDQTNLESLQQVLTKKEHTLIERSLLTILMVSTLLWTVKEALSKILKTGLMIEFSLLEIEEVKKEGNIYISSFTNFSQYKGISFQLGNNICSIVLPKHTEVDISSMMNIDVSIAENISE